MNKPIFARHYQTGECLELSARESILERVRSTADPRARRRWVAPPLVDLQVNGFAGVDFQSDPDPARFIEAARALHEHGCAHFFPTLITDRWPRMIGRLRQLREWRVQNPLLRAAVAGWHIEGPFLSPMPGFHGAHDPARMTDPTPAQIRELREACGTERVLLTLAPERPGALEAVSLAVSLGIAVSLGHTNASITEIESAIKNGAVAFTHLGNACPQQLDRHDNILWRVLNLPRLVVTLIPDQIHVSPLLFRLIHRLLPRGRIGYVTDAMSAAAAPPGRYTLGERAFQVGTDGVVREPGKVNFAGSSLTPLQGVVRAARMLGLPWQQVWKSFSDVPRRLLRLPRALKPGGEASFCLIEDGEGDGLTCTTYVRGEKFGPVSIRDIPGK